MLNKDGSKDFNRISARVRMHAMSSAKKKKQRERREKAFSKMRNEIKALFLCADMQNNCCIANAMLYDAKKASMNFFGDVNTSSSKLVDKAQSAK
jgi:hypothetical protein